jgi:ankyrin repeat protein
VQLARNGANVHHVSNRPDGTTALHECVARGHERVADLLLHYGASPFLENARGKSISPELPGGRLISLYRFLLVKEAPGMTLGLGGAGLTAIDVAINNRNVAMVRKLETRAPFQAMLLMKVPKWANLGTEWKPR